MASYFFSRDLSQYERHILLQGMWKATERVQGLGEFKNLSLKEVDREDHHHVITRPEGMGGEMVKSGRSTTLGPALSPSFTSPFLSHQAVEEG